MKFPVCTSRAGSVCDGVSETPTSADGHRSGISGARLSEVVDGDVERPNDLLGVMIEFADLAEPRTEKLQAVARGLAGESAERRACIGLTRREKTCQIHGDEAQWETRLQKMCF